MSDHKTIYAALAAAQTEMGRALKDSTNPAFKSKYADLASVMDACLPALNKHGIAVFQPAYDDESGRYVKTVLAHASGETLECRVPLILGKADMQGYGSAVTYARRYGLMGMAGIAPDDDDGNLAVASAPNPSTEALRDAWRDGVLDSLPPGSSPRQTAEAFAKAIVADFDVKTLKTLEGRWTRHEKLITSLQGKHPDLWEAIVDGFETRKNELTPNDRMAAE
jgi:hypothetical protein